MLNPCGIRVCPKSKSNNDMSFHRKIVLFIINYWTVLTNINKCKIVFQSACFVKLLKCLQASTATGSAGTGTFLQKKVQLQVRRFIFTHVNVVLRTRCTLALPLYQEKKDATFDTFICNCNWGTIPPAPRTLPHLLVRFFFTNDFTQTFSIINSAVVLFLSVKIVSDFSHAGLPKKL